MSIRTESDWHGCVFAVLGHGSPSRPARSAQPAAYPHKVVTLVTHSSPGGGSDVFLREMTKYLGKYIDATFVVENVQGGSGAKAMARVAPAPADGSVFYATTPTYIYTSLLSKPPNTYKDMRAAGELFRRQRGRSTRARTARSRRFADVIEHAKKDARALGRRQSRLARAAGRGAAEARGRRQRPPS